MKSSAFLVLLLSLISSVDALAAKEKVRFTLSNFSGSSQGDSALFYRQDGTSFCVCLDKVGTGCAPSLSACSGVDHVIQADVSSYGPNAADIAAGFMDGINLSGYTGNLSLTDHFNGQIDIENTVNGTVTDPASNGSISVTVLNQGS